MITEEHIGCRIQYDPPKNVKDRSPKYGFIRGLSNFNKFIDVALDDMSRPTYYVPADCVTLVPEEHPEYVERRET